MNKEKNDRKRIVGYVRVSTTHQATKGESLDTQKQQIEDYCKGKNWELLDIYEDAGISGSKAEQRPSFMKMIDAASEKQFDIILFTKLSRFARNSRDYYNFQHELKEHNVSLASIKESIDPTTHNGKLMAGIFALLADWERDMIREQMTENKMIKWRDKRMFNGQAPYGYSWDKKKCEFKENEEESKILSLMLKRYVNLGSSMKDLALSLNEDGYKSRRAKWATGTLSYILSNPCYRTCELNTNTRVYEDGKRTKKAKNESEWITYDLPRILPDSLLKKVDKKREFNTKKQKRTTWQLDRWLRDSLHCMNCGGKIIAKKGSTRKDGTYPTYYACYWGTCSSKELILSNRKKCIKDYMIASDLEAYVWDYLCFSLTGSHPDLEKEKNLQKKAEKQFSFLTGGNIKKRIKSFDGRIERLIDEKKKKKRANNRILELLEDENCALQTINLRLKENEQKINRVNELIAKSENDRLELKEILEDQKSYHESKELLFLIWSDLQEFNSQDKKKMIESLVPEGIKVRPVKKRLGPTTVEMEIIWNPLIFQSFKENEKFPSLQQNGFNYSTRVDI